MKTTSFLVHHHTKRNVVVLSECLNINFIQYSEFNSVKLPSQLIVYLFVFTDLYTNCSLLMYYTLPNASVLQWPYCSQLCTYCNFNKYVRCVQLQIVSALQCINLLDDTRTQ